MDVADDLRVALALSRHRYTIDADIYDCCTVLDPIGGDHFRPTDSGDDDIRRPAFFLDVPGPAVGNRYRTVLSQQEARHGFADYVRPPDYDGIKSRTKNQDDP